MGAVPIEPRIRPKKQAVIPLTKFSVKAPTINNANKIRRNCSPKPKVIIIGTA